jgi:CheY-like chemotaxis protein
MMGQNGHIETSDGRESMPAPGQTQRSLGCGTVFVADDKTCSRDPVAALLTRAGYGILLVYESRDLVTVLEGHSDELVAVLLDRRVQSGSGADVFEQIQRARPNIPVIRMSGFVEKEASVRFMGMGVVGFLQKRSREPSSSLGTEGARPVGSLANGRTCVRPRQHTCDVQPRRDAVHPGPDGHAARSCFLSPVRRNTDARWPDGRYRPCRHDIRSNLQALSPELGRY